MTTDRKQQLQYLLTQFIEAKASTSEQELLFRLLGEEKNAKECEEIIEELMSAEEELKHYNPAEWQPIVQTIIDGRLQPLQGKIRSIATWGKWIAAASILLLLASIVYFISAPKQSQVIARSGQLQQVNDIMPGHDGAVLTLADGNQVVLDSVRNGVVTTQGNTEVKKENGELSYTIKSNGGEVAFNTVSTPKGRTYALMLADGSKVWLNAASSIRFPTAFAGKERWVEITGEAYFEIEHDASKPFHATVNGMDVEVMGTHFNINAYTDEAVMKTTLLQGKVRVKKGTEQGILSPGQQAEFAGNSLHISQVEAEESIAWKNGFFTFNHDDFPAVMRQIARWYDVEVEYSGAVPVKRITGQVSRNITLSELIKMLELTGKVQISSADKKIMVKAN